jgi:tRNA G18 (ribose-2'-O)-methylase SpoU
MAAEKISSFDDPRIAAYRNLKDRDLASRGGRFIAEGEWILRRLLASDFSVESVLLAERRADEFAPIVPGHVPVYVAADEVLRQIIGYKFHSGIIAAGIRKPMRSVDEVVSALGERSTLVICPETADAENMGSMIRLAAAFAADAMVLGERCCDPFYRQSVRVSMGTIFSIPIVQSDNLLRDLGRLRGEHDYELIATVLDEQAEALSGARRGNRLGLLFGNEAQGLGLEHVRACDRQVTIPMRAGVDSLNVAVAAGIVLYHFCGSGDKEIEPPVGAARLGLKF